MLIAVHMFAPALAACQEEPQILTFGTQTLQLNGTGIRTATIFSVDVYRAALYLPEKSSTPENILGQAGVKLLRLSFLRAVEKEDLQDGWDEGFEKAGVDSSSVMEPLAQLKGSMRDVKKGDVLTVAFFPEELLVAWGDGMPTRIAGREFPTALLQTWLGEHPANEKLKRGLLGNL